MSNFAFATNQDEQSGFGGFPIRVQRADEISGGSLPDFPIAVPRAVAVRMYWKIKKWRVHGDVHTGAPINQDYVFDFEATIGDDPGVPSTLSDELQLCFPRKIDADDGDSIGFRLFDFIYSEAPHDAASNVHPLVVAKVLSSAVSVRAETNYRLAGYAPSSIIGKITVGGVDYALTFYQNGVDVSVTGNFTIEEAEEWPWS